MEKVSMEYRQTMRGSQRPSFATVFRSLNRAPFVLGLLAVVSAAFILVGVVAGASFAPAGGLLTLAAIDALLGVVLIVAYYLLRE